MKYDIENLPSHLPEPPPLKDGYKYVYRGRSWDNDDHACCYIGLADRGGNRWDKVRYTKHIPFGEPNCHYLEIVKTETLAPKKKNGLESLKEQRKKALELIGKTVEYELEEVAGNGRYVKQNMIVKKVEILFEAEGLSSELVKEYLKEHGFCVVLRDSYCNIPFPMAKLADSFKIVELLEGYEFKVFKDRVEIEGQEYSIDIIKEIIKISGELKN